MHFNDSNWEELCGVDTEQAKLQMLFAHRQELRRQSRKLYDYSHPVDEWVSDATPNAGPIEIQPDYEIPERIEHIFASLPVGITAATLQLGQRNIILYSGGALGAQTLVSISYTGMILGRSDRRVLSFTGTPTTGFYLGFTGHCIEREGNR